MRVTSTMKNYIERKVSEVYDKKIAEVEKDYLEEEEKVCEEIRVLGRELEEKIASILHRTGFTLCYERDTFFKECDIKKKEQEERIRKERSRLNKKKKDTIQEIIVTLELGGNKADLDKMLKELED